MRMVGRWGFRGWGDKLRSVEVRVCGSPPSALPGISPTRGEIGKTLFRQFILNVEMGETVPQVDLPPCGGDVRQDRGGKPTLKPPLT
jgi:hypothetical protein